MTGAAVVLAAALAATPVAADVADPAAFATALETARPAAEGWPLADARIDLGYGRLDVKQATLVPVNGPGPRPLEFVVLGDARFRLATDDPVESYQIDLFTGADALDETVTQAVLIVGDPKVADVLTSRSGRQPLPPAVAKEASETFAAWRADPAWHHAHAASALFEIATGDPLAQGRFAAWCRRPRLGTFLYTLDPFRPEQIRVEHYVDPRLGDQETLDLRRRLEREREEGKELETRLEDLGDWDTWFSSSARDADGTPRPGHEGFEPRHYELRLGVDQDLLRVEGTATISLEARSPGERVIHLQLNPDLVVGSAKDGAGRTLGVRRDEDRISVFLAPDSVQGSQASIELGYGGVLFDRGNYGPRFKRDTYGWYPHAGTVDRATYHAVYEVPDSIDVLASGTKDGETVSGGRRVQTRTLAFPSANCGFEIGHYAVETHAVGHIQVEIGFLSDVPLDERADRTTTMKVVADALAAYEEAFGPYPLDTLTIATSWQPFAQGYLGFVTLAQDLAHVAGDLDGPGPDARKVIAHELAHQWWGNLVGWDGYRDQWLSEALADYSAALWRRHIARTDPQSRLAGAILDMYPRDFDLGEDTRTGRPVEAIGPVTLGRRLRSSVARAYSPIVYQKGSMVFGMLAERIGEQPFVAMLKEIAQRARGRPIDTRTFVLALEKMSGVDLDAYVREFVDGVGYPEVHYRYTVTPGPDGSWTISGEADQIPRGYRRDRLVAVEGGGVDIAPVYRLYQPAERAELLAPAIVVTGESHERDSPGRPPLGSSPAANRIRGIPAHIALSGPVSPLSLTVKDKPIELRVDPTRSLPFVVCNDTVEEKRGFILRAEALRSAGRADEAAAAFRKALDAPFRPLPDVPFGQAKGDVAATEELLDFGVRISLAEMALDAGRQAEAEAELAAPEFRRLCRFHSSCGDRLRLVDARLALRKGDAKQAYGILSDLLALRFRQTENDTAGDAMRASKFRDGMWGTGGDYLLLAAAAERTGHDVVAREAAAEALRRGAIAPGPDAPPQR